MKMRQPATVVLDTNVLVGAGFNAGSASAEIIEQIRAGRLRMVWDDANRRETERIVSRIPPLSEMEIADLFREEDRYDGQTHPEQFQHMSDPDDRKFAALAEAADAVLITSDDHLLSVRGQIATAIQTPGEFWRRMRE
jgi:uncharacterized protein